MKLRILVLTAVAVALTMAWPNYSRPIVRSTDGEEHVAGQLIIQLSQPMRGQVHITTTDGVARFGIPALDDINQRWHVDDVTPLMMTPHPSPLAQKMGCDLEYVVEFGADQDITPVAAGYRASPDVEWVCPNTVMRTLEVPNDPDFSMQWHLSKIGAPAAWDLAHGDTSVVNCVVDDGCDFYHPDIEANIWINNPEDINHNRIFDTLDAPAGDVDGIDQDGNGYTDDVIGWDFVSGEPIPMPNGSDDHGTHCWGITNAVVNNSVGVAGATWNTRSMAVRAGGGGFVNTAAATAAIYYGVSMGAFSFSMSFGSGSQNTALRNACEFAWSSGCVLFAAAGNDYAETRSYPACYDNVECVAASDQNDLKTDFSNYGTWVDVTAPGTGIYSTVPRAVGSYAMMDGTSMACPLAAGVACWIKSWNLMATNQQVLDMLHAGCAPMPNDPLFAAGKLGAGRVDMALTILPHYRCDLRLTNWRFNDAGGNNNGRPDPGETAALIVTYANTAGWQDASGVTATVSCTDPDVVVDKANASFPNIPAGASGDCSADSFVITVPPTVPPQYLTFYVTVSATPQPASPDGGLRVRAGLPRLLIVDGDVNANSEHYYTAACDTTRVLYDVYSILASGSPSAETLEHYPVVFWYTGNKTTGTLSATDQASLTAYLNNGGNLCISGQNIAHDLGNDGFLADYLHAQFVVDSTAKLFQVGLAGDPIADGDTMCAAGSGGAGNARSLDGIKPLNGALGCAYYKDYGDTTVYAVIRYSGTYRLVYFATPFEALDHAVSHYLQKWTLVRRILQYFGEGLPGVSNELPAAPPGSRPYALTITPNPVARGSQVSFIAPVTGSVTLRMYNVSGRQVYSESRSVTLGARTAFRLDGSSLPSGMYLVQVVTDSGIYAQKATVLR